MDAFAEYIVQRKKDTKDRLIIVGVILLGVAITLFGSPFLSYLGSFSLLFLVGMWYGAYILITGRNLEYEYAVTNGELDVDMIMARRKRKKVLNVKLRELELIAPVGDEKFKKDFTNTNIKKVIDASSNDEKHNRYFAILRKDGEIVKLIFEPSLKMLKIFQTYKQQSVFLSERDGEIS